MGFFVYFQGTRRIFYGSKSAKNLSNDFNKYFDEKFITIRCVVLEISYFEKSLEIEVVTPFTAIGRNMKRITLGDLASLV